MSDPVQHKPVGFFRDDSGDFSMGRLIAFIAVVLGALCILTGLWLAAFGAIQRISTSTPLVVSGLGVVTSGTVLHGWQKQTENR